MDLLALADDLTGALEVGAAFSSAGLVSLVTLDRRMNLDELEESIRVLVIDTESRHLSAAGAYSVVQALAGAAHAREVPRLFKKTDSTLRGNIASELAALVDACPDSPMLYAPAYPRMGRTVRDGILYVDGTPAGESSFSRDELNPVRESSILALLGAGDFQVPILSVRPEMLRESLPAGVYVVDGKDEEDLRIAARFFAASRRFRLAAGPAGFAHCLAQALNPAGLAPAAWPGIESCIVVNGSRHPASTAQVQHARSAGWPAAFPAGARLVQCGWSILDHPPTEAETALEFAERLGRLVGEIGPRVEFGCPCCIRRRHRLRNSSRARMQAAPSARGGASGRAIVEDRPGSDEDSPQRAET